MKHYIAIISVSTSKDPYEALKDKMRDLLEGDLDSAYYSNLGVQMFERV